MTTYNGKCHCGQTEWTIKMDKEQQNHVVCHCDTCQKLSGGAFTLNQLVPKEAIKVTKGNPKVYTYSGDSGNPVHCYYCPNCTSHIYHHQTVSDKFVARNILLDGGKDFGVAAEIYGRDRLPWQKEVATTFELTPPH